MAEQIDQRNDQDLMLPANLRQLLCLFPGKASSVRHFRAAGELKTVINAKNENVHRARRQIFLDELDEFIQAIRRWRWDAKCPDRQRLRRVHSVAEVESRNKK